MPEKRLPSTYGSTNNTTVNGQLVINEKIPDLKFPQSLVTYSKMKADPLISGQLFLIKQFLRKVEFRVSPKGGINATDEAKRMAEKVNACLFQLMDRSFDQVVVDISSFIENGFSLFEPVYKWHEGDIVWKDISSRPATSIKGFKFKDNGDLQSVEQYKLSNKNGGLSLSGSVVQIPYKRLLHFRTDTEHNNPLGRSILNNAYYAWYFKQVLSEHEAVGIERELNGLPVIRIPMEYFTADPEENPTEYAILQEFIRVGKNARSNEQACVILPSDVDETSNAKMFDFDLIASRGTRSIDTSKVIERYDFRIAQSMLGDFILMGSSSSGSFALSDNKLHTFVQSLEAYLDIIAEQFNRKAIPKLYDLNGWDKSLLCELQHSPIGRATLGELGSFLKSCAPFITPDKTLENALRQRADLPDRDDDNAYISTPVSVSQALSQRIAMTSSYEDTDNIESTVEGSDELGKIGDEVGGNLSE